MSDAELLKLYVDVHAGEMLFSQREAFNRIAAKLYRMEAARQSAAGKLSAAERELGLIADRVEKMEAALREYEKRANWASDVCRNRWIGSGDNGWEPAEEALK